MATAADVILNQLQSGMFLIEKFTEDLSDAEYLAMPAPGTNHAMWILGHIAVAEDSMVSKLTGAKLRLPEATHTLFSGGSKCVGDAAAYPSRKEIDEMFRNTRAHTVEALQTADLSTFDDAAPEGLPKELFPTVGACWGLQGTHQFWHIGHLSACRAAMNKKRVLG